MRQRMRCVQLLYTYVVAALSSLATLIYYIMIYMGRRD